MSIRYNLNLLSREGCFSVYDLAAGGIIGASTCNALFKQQPVTTKTLVRLLDFADCSLGEFLTHQPEGAKRRLHARHLDLNGMVRRGIISRTAKRQFIAGSPMYLSTLIVMAEDQGVNLLDFLRVETEMTEDASGNLKKRRKVLYLSEW